MNCHSHEFGTCSSNINNVLTEVQRIVFIVRETVHELIDLIPVYHQYIASCRIQITVTIIFEL